MRLFFLIFIVLVSDQLAAQYSPYFENYSLSQYNAGNQNWGISKADNGKLYVANNNGLLVFNGSNWKIHPLPNKTTVRSVLAAGDKIYTGSYEEFGYWSYNEKGVLIYHSLSHLLHRNDTLNEEFWQILTHQNKIVFRSFSGVYVYENNTIIKIKPDYTVISCALVDEKIYVSTLKDGIFILENNMLKPFIKDKILKNTKVVGIAIFQNKLLLATALKGCFTYENGIVQSIDIQINDALKKYQLNSISKLDSGNMVFGTIKNGVYITDNNGRILSNINKENGLINNTVLRLLVTKDSNIWLGLDNGLARINLKNNIAFYNDTSGKLGAVYDVINFKNTTYIGSNTGLYYLNKDHGLEFIGNSQGQVWSLKEINGDLFCGHNDGTYLVNGNSIKLISNFTGGWITKKVPEKDIFLQGTYAGIVRFEKKNNKWHSKHLGKTTVPIRFLVFQDQNYVWATHAYKGLYRIKFDNNYDSIIEIKDYKDKGITSDYNLRVYKIKNEIVFKANNGWNKYEPLMDSIVPYDYLNKRFGKEADVISEDDANQLYFKNNSGIINFSEDNTVNNLMLTPKYYNNRLIVGYENISQLNDSIYALSLNDGFVLINAKEKIKLNIPIAPDIEQITINNTAVKLDTATIELPNQGKISISISSPQSNNHYFEYSLSTDATRWDTVENENLVLSNLKSGDFSIRFRTVNQSGDISKAKELKLYVLPPWHKSKFAFILYACIALLVSGVVYLLHKRKIKKEQKLLELEFKQAQELLLKEKNIENERQIIQLKNEALQNDIKLKSKQLANTAIALVKKNEALLDIKRALRINENSFENRAISRKLQKKIDSSIGHKDEWELFEYNFNQVHEKFFNQLKHKHPKLTHKDLKLCAYIKMGLTTKEIAPLMNISIRGVETHRYRLKLKLKLAAKDSLNTYLNTFQ